MLARHRKSMPQHLTGDLRWTAICGNAAPTTKSAGAGLQLPPRPSLKSRPSYVPAARCYSKDTNQHWKRKPSDVDPNPSFSFEGLDASPAVKKTVYVTVGMIATAESYAYGKWLWWKLRPKDLEDIEENAEDT